MRIGQTKRARGRHARGLWMDGGEDVGEQLQGNPPETAAAADYFSATAWPNAVAGSSTRLVTPPRTVTCWTAVSG